MADNNPKPPPKPPIRRPFEDTGKDLEAQDRMDNFEVQRLMSHERDTSDPQGGEILADPDEGGEIEGLDFGRGIVSPRDMASGQIISPRDLASGQVVDDGETDAFGTYDPVEHAFGDGAPPRPVTMTASDLGGAEDPDAGGPDAGGTVVEDPDAGGEIFMPADDGGEIAPDLEPIMIVDTYEPYETFEPEPQSELELTDLETAIDLHEASHTFED
jgi:hypothetical protein